MSPLTEQAFFTLGEAAKAVGRSKSTVSSAIKTGRLSVMDKDEGGYRIAASELFRAFPPEQPNGSANGLTERSRTPEPNGPNPGIVREVELLREERDRERRQFEDTIADLRRRLDGEADERRKLTALLTDQRAREPGQEAPRKPVEGRLARAWGILRGKG